MALLRKPWGNPLRLPFRHRHVYPCYWWRPSCHKPTWEKSLKSANASAPNPYEILCKTWKIWNP